MQQEEVRQQTEEEISRYDRQSFLGHTVQQRLLNSRVLLVELTGSNTELAKNLILSGANISIFDDNTINEQDVDTNFLFGKHEIGLSRGQLGMQKLKEINDLVSIERVSGLDIHQIHRVVMSGEGETVVNLKKFHIISTTTKCFKEMSLWDEVSRKLNIPYYNLVCCGLYGFIYIGLGSSFVYQREKQQVRILSMASRTEQKEEKRYREFEEVNAVSLPLKDVLDQSYRITQMPKNDIYYCVLMMSQAQEVPDLKTFDPFDKSEQNTQKLDQITQIGVSLYEKIYQKPPSEQTVALFRNFARLFSIDFCPTYSVLGSVASQEFIITISRINEPAINWFCYDSQLGYGVCERVQDVKKFQTKDLPELKQEIISDN